MCVYMFIYIYMNSLVVSDTLTYPKYLLEKIFYIFLVHKSNISGRIDNNLFNVPELIDWGA